MSRPPERMARSEAASLLGVDAAASAAEVQRAFQRAARGVHPDLLGEVDEVELHAAEAAFVQLARAREVLLSAAPEVPAAVRPGDPGGPVLRQVPGRGLGGSLVVLALLAFLLVGLVSAEQAFRGSVSDPPASGPATPAP